MTVLRGVHPSPEAARVADLVEEQLQQVQNAVAQAFGLINQLRQPCVVLEDSAFQAMFPDITEWALHEDIDSDPDLDSEWSELSILELLGVAARWPAGASQHVALAPAGKQPPTPGQPVVALNAQRLVECAVAHGFALVDLLRTVLAHEYAHHGDGVVVDDSVQDHAETARIEHSAQIGAWNALTLLGDDGDASRRAMRDLAPCQPSRYQRFIHLPAIKASHPDLPGFDDWWLVPVSDTEMGSRVGVDQSVADALRRQQVGTVVLVDRCSAEYAAAVRHFGEAVAAGGSDLSQLLENLAKQDASVGSHRARGPYRLIDVEARTLQLGPANDDSVRDLLYVCATTRDMPEAPLRLRDAGGSLEPASGNERKGYVGP